MRGGFERSNKTVESLQSGLSRPKGGAEMTKRELSIFTGGILAVIALVGGTVGHFIGLEQAFIAGLTAALVYVTAFYVYLTSQTVEAANKQAQIMLSTEFNAAAPVIKLEVKGRGQISVTWENIGKGPALNLQCWIEDEGHPELREYKTSSTAIAVGKSDTGFICADLHTGIQDYVLQVGCVRVQYESVFKNKTYESCLVFSTDATPELTYREVNGGGTAQGAETQLDRIERSIQNATLSSTRFTILAIGLAAVIASVSIPAIGLWLRLILLGVGLGAIIFAPRYGGR